VDDLRSSLTRAGFRDFKIERRAARILVRAVSDPERAASILGKVFGVAYAAPVDIVPGRIDDVLQAVVKNADESLAQGESFAIRSRHPKISQLPRREIETRGGAEVLRQLADREVIVNLEEPDVLISVDTADDLALIYRKRVPGPGGLPLSSRWKMIVVLDSGFFSILAAVAMMRRGCLVEPFIPTSRRGSKFVKETQLTLARRLGELVPRPYIGHVVDLDVIQKPGISEISDQSVRKMAAQFAITKFRGVIFSDICGDISQVSMNHYQVPTFYPLLGLEFEELSSLCDLAGISKDEFNVQLSSERNKLKDPSELADDLGGNIVIEKVSLGLATDVHDHIAC